MRLVRSLPILAILFLLTGMLKQAYAQESTTLYLFWGDGCPHCAAEERFLDQIKAKYPTLEIKKLEVWGSAKNQEILKKVGKKLNADVRGVPFTVVGNNYVGGFYNNETTGVEIENYIKSCLQDGCVDVVAEFISPPKELPKEKEESVKLSTSTPKEVKFPIIGNVDLTKLSLPMIAVVIGTLDGFNPCAMWILLFLISLLLDTPSRKRRWLLGGAFILSSGLAYFLFMAAWLNILLFIGFIFWIRATVAIFALGSGAFSLNKFWEHRTGCVVERNEERKKTFEKLRNITQDKNLLIALAGIALLAFAVNLVELLCSAGFPAIFTQILALNHLQPVEYYLYILLYLFFFMLDDMIVFAIAMKTLETTGISTKYSKYSHLIGGILMVLVGALLLFKPQILMFNF